MFSHLHCREAKYVPKFFLETFPEQRLLDSGCFPLIRTKISVRITGISYPRSRGFIFSTSQSNVRQEDNDSRYNQIFENFSPLISFPSPKFSGEWFELQKFNNSRILRKLYQEISVLFDPVSKSSGVWWNGKGPMSLSLNSLLKAYKVQFSG